MRLKKILKNLVSVPDQYSDWNIEHISCDSRTCVEKTCFIALKGSLFDGNKFVHQAIDHGANVIITDNKESVAMSHDDVCFLYVEDPHVVLKKIAVRFYDTPSKKIQVAGITGTNGKTTVSYLIEAILNEARNKCGVIGTINHRCADKTWESHNTTPGLLENQEFLSRLVDEHIDYCVMEVSSHALDQGRVEFIDFDRAIFTNLSSDHLDYHKTTDQYFQAKSLLFKQLKERGLAIINGDDPRAEELLEKIKADVIKYGLSPQCDICADEIVASKDGMQFLLKMPQQEIIIRTSLIGTFNIYNIMAAAACCFSWGIDLKIIKAGIERLLIVPGRLERIEATKGYSIFVDYAHTQDALEKVLIELKKYTDEKVICVFGCGGDRDAFKRKEMGEVAARLADISIVTTDNPRNEEPQKIIDDIVTGFSTDNYCVEIDRRRAIERAIKIARKEDIILIAGKGHEEYQIFKDETIAFNEKEIIKEICECLA